MFLGGPKGGYDSFYREESSKMESQIIDLGIEEMVGSMF